MASYRFSYVFRMECDPPLYLWSGLGDLATAPDTIDPAGATWQGAGQLLSVPSIKQLINGVADRLEFTVSGVAPETLRLAQEDRPSVKGAVARLGRVDFGDDWQPLGPIEWLWKGVAGVILTSSSMADNGRVRTISLSIPSADTTRANPVLTFFTAADQAKRSPTDAFCSHVAGITRGTTRRFGPK